MSGKKRFIRTASVTGAAVAAAAFPLTADAADPIEPIETSDYGYFLSLEGGALFAEPALDKVGFSTSPGSAGDFDLDNFDDELGVRGAAAFGQHFSNGWDWRIGVAVSRFRKNDASSSFEIGSGGGFGSGSSGESDSKTDIDYETADLEIGYRPNQGGNLDVRFFGGLRFLHSEDSQNSSLSTFSGGFFSGISIDAELETKTEFIGIGPRLGMDFATRMQDSPFGLSGMVAGAAIFGRRETKAELEFQICSGGVLQLGGCDESGGSEEDDESETILNLEAALGVDLHVTDSSKVTIGYRGEYWADMNGTADKLGGSGGGGIFDVDEDLLAHGPFLRLLWDF